MPIIRLSKCSIAYFQRLAESPSWAAEPALIVLLLESSGWMKRLREAADRAKADEVGDGGYHLATRMLMLEDEQWS
jgi:hypothetical protein